MDQEGRLSVLGQNQLVLGSFPGQTREVDSQDIVGLLVAIMVLQGDSGNTYWEVSSFRNLINTPISPF